MEHHEPLWSSTHSFIASRDGYIFSSRSHAFGYRIQHKTILLGVILDLNLSFPSFGKLSFQNLENLESCSRRIGLCQQLR